MNPTNTTNAAGNAPAFTPGPWSLGIHRTNPRNFVKIEARDSLRVICDAFSHSDEDFANARLIAAAPELLKALAAIVSERDSAALADDPAYLMIDRAIETARNVLYRATGQA